MHRDRLRAAGAALELVLARRRLREQASDRIELSRHREVRRGRDRDLLRAQVVAGEHDRDRLERLGRRAEKRDQCRVPRLLDDRAVADGDRVHDVHRLVHDTTTDDYPQRLHARHPTRHLPFANRRMTFVG
jgi:hypothetical protein